MILVGSSSRCRRTHRCEFPFTEESSQVRLGQNQRSRIRGYSGRIVFAWGRITGPQFKKSVEHALGDAPLSALADVTRIGPDSLLRKLKEHGIVATSGQSLYELSIQYHASENRLLAIIFLP